MQAAAAPTGDAAPSSSMHRCAHAQMLVQAGQSLALSSTHFGFSPPQRTEAQGLASSGLTHWGAPACSPQGATQRFRMSGS